MQYPQECATADAIHLEAYVPQNGALSVRIRPLDTVDKTWIPNEAGGGKQWFEYPQGAKQHHIDLEPYADHLGGIRFEVEVRATAGDQDARPILHTLSVPPRACLH